MLAAFDTGIGTGSSVMGWIIDHAGFRAAFALAAILAAAALPLFNWGTGLFSTGFAQKRDRSASDEI